MDLPLWSNVYLLSCVKSVVCTLLWYKDCECLFLKRCIGQRGCLCIYSYSLHPLPEAWHLSFTFTLLVAQMLRIHPTCPHHRWCWNSSRSYPKLSQLPNISDVNDGTGRWSGWRWPHQTLNTEEDTASKHILNELKSFWYTQCFPILLGLPAESPQESLWRVLLGMTLGLSFGVPSVEKCRRRLCALFTRQFMFSAGSALPIPEMLQKGKAILNCGVHKQLD